MRYRAVCAVVWLSVLPVIQGCGNNPQLDSLLLNAVDNRLDQAIEDAVTDEYGDRGGTAILVGDAVTDVLVGLFPSPIAIVFQNRFDDLLASWRSRLAEVEETLKERLIERVSSIQEELLMTVEGLRRVVAGKVAEIAESDVDAALVVNGQLGRFELETLRRGLETLRDVEAEYREVIEAFQVERSATQADLEAEAVWRAESAETDRSSLSANRQAPSDEAVTATESLAERSRTEFSQLADDLDQQAGEDAQFAMAELQAELERILEEVIATIDPDSATLEEDLSQRVDEALLSVDAALEESASRLRTVVQIANERLAELRDGLQGLWAAPSN